MVTCTWNRCGKAALAQQLDQHGRPWAHLCQEHSLQLETVIRSSDPKAVVRAWISAKGGPEAAAKSMAPATKALGDLFSAIGTQR